LAWPGLCGVPRSKALHHREGDPVGQDLTLVPRLKECLPGFRLAFRLFTERLQRGEYLV
jgi:hypothetical protein